MENNYAKDRNQYQIIRKDARNCFVETKSDSFPIGKVHLEFATYDASRPLGQRQINHIHIYIDIAEFLYLWHFVLFGGCHARAIALKNGSGTEINTPLYQSLGGTSAKRLSASGRTRQDGMSQSRSVKLFAGKKADYLFCAESGPGEEDAKGLIVPKYGSSPEHKVSVSMTFRSLNEIMLVTKAHYDSWLASQYMREYKPPQFFSGKDNGKSNVMGNGNTDADDTQMF